MAIVAVAHHPELTPQVAMEIFQKNFAGKYQVSKLGKIRGAGYRNFIVTKNSLVAVTVKLKHEDNRTSFVFTGVTPSPLCRLLLVIPFFLGLLPGLLIYFMAISPRYKEMESEIKSFIKNAPEFK